MNVHGWEKDKENDSCQEHLTQNGGPITLTMASLLSLHSSLHSCGHHFPLGLWEVVAESHCCVDAETLDEDDRDTDSMPGPAGEVITNGS